MAAYAVQTKIKLFRGVEAQKYPQFSFFIKSFTCGHLAAFTVFHQVHERLVRIFSLRPEKSLRISQWNAQTMPLHLSRLKIHVLRRHDEDRVRLRSCIPYCRLQEPVIERLPFEYLLQVCFATSYTKLPFLLLPFTYSC